MKHNYCFKFLIIILLLSQRSLAAESGFVNLKAFYFDWMSRKAIELKQNQAAHELVLKALENQELTSLQSNLGITFDLIEKKEDAEKSFLSAIDKSASIEEKFKYEFNLAALYGAQKKIPEALTHYQAALDIIPTSTEVKHNIELLIQQQKQDQKNKKDDKEKKDGDKGESEKDSSKDGDNKDKKDENKESKEDDKKNDQDQKPKDQDRKSNAKYKPRPFKGDQLSEGDVKKILGELSQQDQKIRSQFNKKDKQRKEDKNDKDW